MRLAIVADAYPPLRTSGAVQLRDLSRELAGQGHEIVVLVASPGIDEGFAIEELAGVTVARLKSPVTKDVSYLRRTLGEFLMPHAMIRNFGKSPLADTGFDGVIWYSPTIFLAPAVRWLKRRSRCPSYLIVRDIFPQWAADMGLIGRGPVFRILDEVAQYQYRSADTIGVQTPGDLVFFDGLRAQRTAIAIEVLPNWIADATNTGCAIDVAATPLKGRKIFVYAGNMGVAQQMDKLVDLAAALRERNDVGFLFVGRGSEAGRLRARAASETPGNTHFADEIAPEDIPGLYRQCQVGMVALDHRLTSHNIPGKFLTYMQAGLPVLACINPGNDLKALVEVNRVGRVSEAAGGEDLPALVDAILAEELDDPEIAARCRHLCETMFSARAAADRIVSALRR